MIDRVKPEEFRSVLLRYHVEGPQWDHSVLPGKELGNRSSIPNGVHTTSIS